MADQVNKIILLLISYLVWNRHGAIDSCCCFCFGSGKDGMIYACL